MSIYEKYKYKKNDENRDKVEKELERFESGEFVGVTRHYYTDSDPYELVGISDSRKSIQIRSMSAELVKPAKMLSMGGFVGHSDNYSQEWKVESDPDGHVLTARLRKDGRYYLPGRSQKPLTIGVANKFYDYNF